MNAKNVMKGLKTTAVSALVTLGATGAAAAASCPGWLPEALCSGEDGALSFDLQSVIRIFLYIVIVAAILWSLWNIVRAGLEYSSAAEDPEKKKKATQRIISAVVGLVIVVVSFVILSLIGSWFGADTGEQIIGIPCQNEDGDVGVWVKYESEKYSGCGGVTAGDDVCVNPETGECLDPQPDEDE